MLSVCISVFCMVLRKNRDYLPKQHGLIALYNQTVCVYWAAGTESFNKFQVRLHIFSGQSGTGRGFRVLLFYPASFHCTNAQH